MRWLREATVELNREEGGQYVVLFLLVVTALVILAGLVVDGGRAYAAYRQAQVAADAAAQAAAHQVNQDAFFAANIVALRMPEAMMVAQEYADRNSRVPLEVLDVYVNPDGATVTVEARAYVETYFLRLAGIRRVRPRVVGHAVAAWGLNREGE
jgi:Flp pilus assembly protein TadG